MNLDTRHFKSQWNTDKMILNLLKEQNFDLEKGIFIDIGCYDGVKLDNTFFLEKMLDWSGVLVEPIPELCQQAKINRWNPVFHGCIYTNDGYTDFQRIIGYSEMLSSVKHYSDFQKRVEHEIKDRNQTTKILRMPCLTLNTLMKVYNIKSADYLSLSAVTCELDILKEYDVKKNPIKIISLDFNGTNKMELLNWFNDNNYTLYWKHSNSDEHIFINNNLKYTWE